MTPKKTIQLPSPAATKEMASQLAGKQTASKPPVWTQTFAASGAKAGGKVNQ